MACRSADGLCRIAWTCARQFGSPPQLLQQYGSVYQDVCDHLGIRPRPSTTMSHHPGETPLIPAFVLQRVCRRRKAGLDIRLDDYEKELRDGCRCVGYEKTYSKCFAVRIVKGQKTHLTHTKQLSRGRFRTPSGSLYQYKPRRPPPQAPEAAGGG